MTTKFEFETIAHVESCFKEKFGIPRQPGLAPAALATIVFSPPYNRPEAVQGLEQSSHIWLHFIFHETQMKEWKPSVRPPRLGGNKKMGVFATRSPVRPNRLGLSVVKLEGISHEGDKLQLLVSGADLLDGTPIVDIKPYVPYVDRVDEASNAFAADLPAILPVEFSAQAREDLLRYDSGSDSVEALVIQVLQQDPRPSYQAVDESRVYGMKLADFDLQWRYCERLATDEQAVAIEVLALRAVL